MMVSHGLSAAESNNGHMIRLTKRKKLLLLFAIAFPHSRHAWLAVLPLPTRDTHEALRGINKNPREHYTATSNAL
jgi:hypothetical protein